MSSQPRHWLRHERRHEQRRVIVDVGFWQLLQMMLGALRRIMDRVQALQRIGDVRIEIGDDETDCIASALIVGWAHRNRSEEHTSELQSLMRRSYAVFCLKKTKLQ